LIAAFFVVLLAGCGTNSANMRVGTEQPCSSLGDQRAAARSVVVVDIVPEGASVMGEVDASRCHRNMLDKAPTNDEVIADLTVAAYARGADGIAGVQITEQVASALLKNCWSALVGRGTMFRVSPRK
jgi:hypothetical protein